MKRRKTIQRTQILQPFKTLKEIEVVGDKLCNKEDESIRLYFENFNGLYEGKQMHNYDKQIRKYTKLNSIRKRLGIDILSGAETNVQWEMVRAESHWKNRITQEPAEYTVSAHNTH